MSEDEQFQSADKQLTMEVVNFIGHSYKDQCTNSLKKSQKLSWKYQASTNPSKGLKQKKPSGLPYTQNISFQDQQRSSEDQYEVDINDTEQTQYSSLYEHYKGFEQTYKKKISLGTNWIGKKQYFASIFIDPTKFVSGAYFSDQQIQTDKQSVFDADFQSGNLFCVYKIGEFEYDLILQNDINTKGNTQWFYFRLTNPPKKQNIKINIVNLRKSDSLFNYGMMPCIFSNQANKKSSIGWIRKAANVRYFKNDHQIQNSRRYYYTLSFTISTPYQNDVIRIAQCYPYTFSDLNLYLQNIQKVKYKKELVERETIMTTLGKNKIQMLTIKETNLKLKDMRPLIIVLARQHPGQTPGSFVCEGLIDFFLSKDRDSEYLRKNYEIKIIPMINPDGVSVGNYRTNLLGYDLNRRWDSGARIKLSFETVNIKKFITQLTKGRQTAFILDLHGHSRKLFSFFYGNPCSANPFDARMYPMLCSKMAPNFIRFEDSTFFADQYKRATARVQFNLSYKIQNVFTFQTSFFGYINKEKEKKHYTIDGYKHLGMILGKAIYVYERSKENLESKEALMYKKCLNQLRGNINLIKMGEKNDSGSQSCPEECQVRENEVKKLQQNEEYSKQVKLVPKHVKIVKRIMRKELNKEQFKSSRQMQVLDIARVNSIFPNDVLALIPSSYYIKPKKSSISIGIQTQNNSLLKIYEACKLQQLMMNPEAETRNILSHPVEKSHELRQNSNLFKSSMLIRPHSSAMTCATGFQSNYSSIIQRKTREMSLKKKESLHQIARFTKVGSAQHKLTQTLLSYGGRIMNTRIIEETTPLQQNNSTNYSTLQHPNTRRQNRSIGKPIVRHLIESVSHRKKSIY